MGDAARPFLLSVLTAAIVGQAVIARKKEILVLISISDFCELWPCRFARGPTLFGRGGDRGFHGGRGFHVPGRPGRTFSKLCAQPSAATLAPLQ